MSSIFSPELLHELENTPAQIIQFVDDPDFAFQEKFNGHRRIVFKQGTSIFSLNKAGERRDVPHKLLMQIRRDIRFDFVIDAELIGNELRIFDAMVIGDRDLYKPSDPEPYAARIQAVHDNFGSYPSWATPAYTAYGREAKIILATRLINEKAEGLVIRRLHAPYRMGVSHQHFKIKFTKTLDAVVMNFNKEGKRSVDIGLFNEVTGKLQRVAGCSLLGKSEVAVGDVIEVTYLYASRDQHIVQPRMTVRRDDKPARACTTAQLVYNKDHQPERV